MKDELGRKIMADFANWDKKQIPIKQMKKMKKAKSAKKFAIKRNLIRNIV